MKLRRGLHALVADEEGLLRDALCALLREMPGIARVSASAIGPAVLPLAESLRPDLLITEFPGPAEGGAALVAELKKKRPDMRIVVLSFQSDRRLVDEGMRAGASAYLLKRDTLAELNDAIRTVLSGRTYLSGRAMRGTWRASAPVVAERSAADDLTFRELQVIRLIAQGHRTREIAELLSLSHKTVEKHRASIMRKLGLRNASAVAAFATTHGLADR